MKEKIKEMLLNKLEIVDIYPRSKHLDDDSDWHLINIIYKINDTPEGWWTYLKTSKFFFKQRNKTIEEIAEEFINYLVEKANSEVEEAIMKVKLKEMIMQKLKEA